MFTVETNWRGRGCSVPVGFLIVRLPDGGVLRAQGARRVAKKTTSEVFLVPKSCCGLLEGAGRHAFGVQKERLRRRNFRQCRGLEGKDGSR